MRGAGPFKLAEGPGGRGSGPAPARASTAAAFRGRYLVMTRQTGQTWDVGEGGGEGSGPPPCRLLSVVT